MPKLANGLNTGPTNESRNSDEKAGASTATGVTESERYLGAMCKRSFLSLWSYQNIYTDKGRRGGKGDGKEFCDLMVVFGEHIVLFSDKDNQFGQFGNPDTNWRRWFKKAVVKSIKQLLGANRWLHETSGRLFLDRQCTTPFPLELPDLKYAKVHLVAVAVGAARACRTALGGSGSIMIRPDVHGEAANLEAPFVFGLLDTGGSFTHVFDEVALDCVLRELDTVSDFTKYLTCREQLLTSGRLLVAAGEEDLLGLYLQNVDADGDHEFPIIEGAGAVVDAGIFASLVASEPFQRKQQADRVSYHWDSLIEMLSRSVADGSLEFGSQHGPDYGERAIRIMAAEPRLRRRILSEALLEKLHAAPIGSSSGRSVVSNTDSDVGYVFYVCSLQENEAYLDYRKRRTFLLYAHCMVLKLKWPRVKHVVGIGMEPKGSKGGSEDLITLDVREWSAEQDAEARSHQAEFSIFLDKNVKLTQDNYDEFPK